MSLDDFESAEATSGRIYELARGMVVVIEVPGRPHVIQLNAVRRQFSAYDVVNPGTIRALLGSGECKVLVTQFDTERHPDLAVYKTAPPDEDDFWASWVPEIVVEVVSPSSRRRDYVEKREEDLARGALEYWIVDGEREELLVLRRSRGAWVEHTVKSPKTCRTRLLPGFEFDVGAAFQARA
ncbi:MAG TPA: Uma2 family endonuclease [Pirellulales bacterium]|jgi:Uma2 family endonuclease|nr:Uma2 family endonuclease [Pirellulales bacterium]